MQSTFLLVHRRLLREARLCRLLEILPHRLLGSLLLVVVVEMVVVVEVVVLLLRPVVVEMVVRLLRPVDIRQQVPCGNVRVVVPCQVVPIVVVGGTSDALEVRFHVRRQVRWEDLVCHS